MDKPFSYTPAAAQKAWAYSEALKSFDGNEDKAKIASDAYACGLEYIRKMPKGWNANNTQAELRAKCETHVTANLNAKPYGFFALPIVGWFFWTALSGLISWAVQRLLDIHFPKKTS